MNSFSGQIDRRTAKEGGRTYAEVVAGLKKRLKGAVGSPAPAANSEEQEQSLLSNNQTTDRPSSRKRRNRSTPTTPAVEAAAETNASGTPRSPGLPTQAAEITASKTDTSRALNGDPRPQASVLLKGSQAANKASKREADGQRSTDLGDQSTSGAHGDAQKENVEAEMKREVLQKLRANKAKTASKPTKAKPERARGIPRFREEFSDSVDASIPSRKRSKPLGTDAAENNDVSAKRIPRRRHILEANHSAAFDRDDGDGTGCKGSDATGSSVDGALDDGDGTGGNGSDATGSSVDGISDDGDGPGSRGSDALRSSVDGILSGGKIAADNATDPIQSNLDSNAAGATDPDPCSQRSVATTSNGPVPQTRAPPAPTQWTWLRVHESNDVYLARHGGICERCGMHSMRVNCPWKRSVHTYQLPEKPEIAAMFTKCIHGGWCRDHCPRSATPTANGISNSDADSDKELWGRAQHESVRPAGKPKGPPADTTFAVTPLPFPVRAAAEVSTLSSVQQVGTPGRESGRAAYSSDDGKKSNADCNTTRSSSGSEAGESRNGTPRLAKREKLRQRIMEGTGCDFATATLALATADAQDPGPLTPVYRGDAWRVNRACEIVTSKSAEMRAEQRAKWTKEVQLAAQCTLPLAQLAVAAAERVPTLVRDGKLQVRELVTWAKRWVEERRAKRRTPEQEYEDDHVRHIQRVNAARERERRIAEQQAQESNAVGPLAKTTLSERLSDEFLSSVSDHDAGEHAKYREELRLTREAVGILLQIEEPLDEMLPPLNWEDETVTELTAELMAAAQSTFGTDVEPLSLKTALNALEAGRYRPGQEGWPSVEAALLCLQKRQRNNPRHQEGEEIARKSGGDLKRGEQAGERQSGRVAATATIPQLWRQRAPREDDERPTGDGAGKQTPREERDEEEDQADRRRSPPEKRRDRAANPVPEVELEGTGNRKIQSGEDEGPVSNNGSRETEIPKEAKRKRESSPLRRGVRRTLQLAGRKSARAAGALVRSSLDGLSRLQKSRVIGRGTTAKQQELARHAAKSNVAKRASVRRQEDMRYALDQHRRMLNGEKLTETDEEWAILGATLSPARVLGMQGGCTREEEETDGNEEFEDLLDAIMEQYECEEHEAVQALETTADADGWNVDAAIDALLERGIRPYDVDEAERDVDELTDTSEVSRSSDSTHDRKGATVRQDGKPTVVVRGHPPDSTKYQRNSRTTSGGDLQKLNATAVFPATALKTKMTGETGSPLQLRYRARSEEPRNDGTTDAYDTDTDAPGERKRSEEEEGRHPPRLSAAGGFDVRGCELTVRQVRRAIDCDDATARLLLMDKRARDKNGTPDAAKAVKLYYEGQKEGSVQQGDKLATDKTLSKIRSAAGNLHSMVLPALTLPDWDVGKAPDGGFTYATFRRIYALFQKYQRQTNFTSTVTMKSLVTSNLRPTIEARCGLSKTIWEDESEGGMADEDFIKKIRSTLKPVRAMEFEVLFEGMKLKHPGNETDILATVEEWGEKWLSAEREAEEQGITLQPGKLKELFKKAVQPISKVSRLILGEPFKSTAEWYTLIINELRLRQSYAAEADRDGKKAPSRNWNHGGLSRDFESPYGSALRGRGGGRGRFSGGHDFRQGTPASPEGDHEAARFNNHSGGAEPMTYTPRGRGRGGETQRGKGGEWPNRGRGSLARGDAAGANRNAESWGHRQPINDATAEATLDKAQGGRGKWWHDSSQLNLFCRDRECGARQDIPFCQGCGQHHHGREWCYKSKEEGFNATGYWCENRKGCAPLTSRTGRPFGPPPARLNHMYGDTTSTEGDLPKLSTAGLA
jgi:hypothetical protein